MIIMQNRRNFIKNLGVLSLSTLSANALLEPLMSKRHKPLGVQLFTFFNTIDNDVKGTLQQIRNIGYREIESAFSLKGGYYGMKPKEFAAMIKDVGLSWQSHHVMGAPVTINNTTFPSLKTDAQALIDSVAEGGAKYLVCASINVETLDKTKESAEILNKAGELAKKAGLIFCYHNHDREFKVMDGQTPFDILSSQIKPDLMKFELDLAWIAKAGIDPVELFKKHPKRFPLVHVKDFDKDFKNLLPVGEGVIDFKNIFDASKIGGIKHFFVEHDRATEAFKSITSSMGYLKKML